jgi:hypothetical protein
LIQLAGFLPGRPALLQGEQLDMFERVCPKEMDRGPVECFVYGHLKGGIQNTPGNSDYASVSLLSFNTDHSTS